MNIHRIGATTCACAAKVICTLAAATLLASFSMEGQKSSATSKASSAGEFDVPIKTVTVDLGRISDPLGSKDHTILSCYYFPSFLVKELYVQNDIGSEWISVLGSRNKLPACKPSHGPEERLLENTELSSEFWGVKNNLVFISCGEIQQAECPFVVYNSTSGKKLFEGDVALSGKDQSIHMQTYSTKAGVVAKYMAATNIGCDLYAKGADCWNATKKRLGLKNEHKPVCEGYPAVYKIFQTDRDESMIGYPVQVAFFPHPIIKTVAGPILCWATH